MPPRRPLRPAFPHEKPAVEALLRAGFGDEEGFLYAFFARVWQRCTVLVTTEGERPAAMAALLPCRVMPEDAQAYYLYALTTLPEYRGRGHASALLDAARERCPRVFLHAADDSLRGFYARLGWRDCIYARRQMLSGPAGPLPEPAAAADYFARRERLAAGKAHVRWPSPLDAFARDLLAEDGGGLYAGENAVFAAAGVQDGVLLLRDLHGPDTVPCALALAAARRCRGAEAVLPCLPDAAGAFPLCQCAGDAPADPLELGFDFN